MRIHTESDMELSRQMTVMTQQTTNNGTLARISIALAVICLMTATIASAARPTDAEHLTWTHGLSQTTVFSIQDDERGSVWFATEDGLNRYDGRTFTIYRNDPSDPSTLPANLVRDVDAGPDGRIWVATEGGGVAVWNPATDSFTRYTQNAVAPDLALSSNYNRAVAADRLGSVWIASRSSGLDRLDPTSGAVVNYKHDSKDPSSLADDRVYELLGSRDGSLFIGTNRGLDRFDATTNSFEHINLGHPAKRVSIRALFEDRSGVLWVGTSGAGLFSFDPLTGKVVHFKHDRDDDLSLGDDTVQSILQDSFGQLWVGTANGLNQLDPKLGGFHRYGRVDISATGGSGSVTALHQDSAGELWVGTELGGLVHWKGKKAIFKDTGRSKADIVTSFTESRNGLFYFGTVGEGLVQVRRNGKMVRFKTSDDESDPDAISDNRVMSLLTDSKGRIWVGTMRGGLSKFRQGRKSFRTFRHDPARPSSLSADGVMTIHEDASGLLWVGTFGGGLNVFDGRKNRFAAYRHDPENPESLSSDRVTAILSTRSGLLWIGTDGGGLNLFDPRTGTAQRFQNDPQDPTSLPADTVCAIYRDDLGTLWIGTRGGGLARMTSPPTFSAGPTFETYSEADGLPNSVVYAIQPDASGRLWLSTNHGLSLFDPAARSFTNFDASDGLQANEFNFGASYRSATGKLFFGGINGYNAFMPSSSPGLDAVENGNVDYTRGPTRRARSSSRGSKAGTTGP